MTRKSYQKLRTALYLNRIVIKDLAKPLNLSISTVYAKFKGSSPWKLDEMYYIMKLLKLPDEELNSYFPRDPYEDIRDAS